MNMKELNALVGANKAGTPEAPLGNTPSHLGRAFESRAATMFAQLDAQRDNTSGTPYQKLLKESGRKNNAPLPFDTEGSGKLVLPGAELTGFDLYSEAEKYYALKVFKSVDRTYRNFAAAEKLTYDEKRAIGGIQKLLKDNYLDRYAKNSLTYKLAEEYFDGYKKGDGS